MPNKEESLKLVGKGNPAWFRIPGDRAVKRAADLFRGKANPRVSDLTTPFRGGRYQGVIPAKWVIAKTLPSWLTREKELRKPEVRAAILIRADSELLKAYPFFSELDRDKRRDTLLEALDDAIDYLYLKPRKPREN